MEKKVKHKKGHYLGMGIAIGIPLGMPIGLAMGNIALGPAIGVPIGLAIGVMMEKKYNADAEELTAEEKRKQKRIGRIMLGLGIVFLIILVLSYLVSRS